ncbi:MAG: hypothetical protein F9K19_24650 [Rhizobiaceae bacterium]|nr:MAG: hypothetical protein F9K19_24650 [Rhizobiaceae bacterium]CAG1015163.1 hypothetical protein RHIZO_04987 [Rhizobiaceae bacterium]
MSRAFATAASLSALLCVAACTTSDVLEPSAIAAPTSTITGSTTTQDVAADASAADALAAPPSGPLPPSSVQTAAIAGQARIHFAPIVGSTVEAVTPLTEQLALRVRESGIAIARSGEPGTTHLLKGYLSAITEGRDTTVIYVWDVLDPAGNRLHRIQGQQKVSGGSGTGWAAVSPNAMRAVADATASELAAWLSARAG